MRNLLNKTKLFFIIALVIMVMSGILLLGMFIQNKYNSYKHEKTQEDYINSMLINAEYKNINSQKWVENKQTIKDLEQENIKLQANNDLIRSDIKLTMDKLGEFEPTNEFYKNRNDFYKEMGIPLDKINKYIVIHDFGTSEVKTIEHAKSSILNTHGVYTYHYIIDRNGKYERVAPHSERLGGTSNEIVNWESIQIVLLGNGNELGFTLNQYKTLRKVIDYIISEEPEINGYDAIRLHNEVNPAEKPTSCPGKYFHKDFLLKNKVEFSLSSYYTPIEGQSCYYPCTEDNKGSYEKDIEMNTQGDPFVTASGRRVTENDVNTVIACDPRIPLGAKIQLKQDGLPTPLVMTCHDRGGAIKTNRIDVWNGIGEEALMRLKKSDLRGTGWVGEFIY